eukprot:CAMPEP_0174892422 /NCGR_PEP_ID=MMETSP0167-20121228/7379_1 /TAXON_ID=38298 /ORGANISM="Rhodella maculata, Strain CCMP736" /LENGTH=557 /DNA_ID=CAMNT_0016130917 /DNA_START=337 /DNA_END=2010 /DNA_ORIENTATION=-
MTGPKSTIRVRNWFISTIESDHHDPTDAPVYIFGLLSPRTEKRRSVVRKSENLIWRSSMIVSRKSPAVLVTKNGTSYQLSPKDLDVNALERSGCSPETAQQIKRRGLPEDWKALLRPNNQATLSPRRHAGSEVSHEVIPGESTIIKEDENASADRDSNTVNASVMTPQEDFPTRDREPNNRQTTVQHEKAKSNGITAGSGPPKKQEVNKSAGSASKRGIVKKPVHVRKMEKTAKEANRSRHDLPAQSEELSLSGKHEQLKAATSLLTETKNNAKSLKRKLSVVRAGPAEQPKDVFNDAPEQAQDPYTTSQTRRTGLRQRISKSGAWWANKTSQVSDDDADEEDEGESISQPVKPIKNPKVASTTTARKNNPKPVQPKKKSTVASVMAIDNDMHQPVKSNKKPPLVSEMAGIEDPEPTKPNEKPRIASIMAGEKDRQRRAQTIQETVSRLSTIPVFPSSSHEAAPVRDSLAPIELNKENIPQTSIVDPKKSVTFGADPARALENREPGFLGCPTPDTKKGGESRSLGRRTPNSTKKTPEIVRSAKGMLQNYLSFLGLE